MPSRPENGGWRGPERSDNTASVFRPTGLGLDGEGGVAPSFSETNKGPLREFGIQQGTSPSVNASSIGMFWMNETSASFRVSGDDNVAGSLGGSGGGPFLRNHDNGCYYNSNGTNGLGYAIVAVIYAR